MDGRGHGSVRESDGAWRQCAHAAFSGPALARSRWHRSEAAKHPRTGLQATGRVAFFLRPPAPPACRTAWNPLQQSVHLFQLEKGTTMSISLILLIILILILIGVLPTWGHSRSWGYGPSGGVGLVVVILLILLLMGRI